MNVFLIVIKEKNARISFGSTIHVYNLKENSSNILEMTSKHQDKTYHVVQLLIGQIMSLEEKTTSKIIKYLTCLKSYE